MVLIQSDSNDASTNDILDWIYYLKPETRVERINDAQEITQLCYNINNEDSTLKLKTGSAVLATVDCQSFWYRRGVFSNNHFVRSSMHHKMGWEAQHHLESELDYLLSAINGHLQDRHKGINKAQDNNTNKIRNLELARKAGLAIPDTLICTQPEDLYAFLMQHQQVISKPICQGWTSFSPAPGKTIHVSNSTELLHASDIPTLKQKLRYVRHFLPSLFQQYIDKKFELRIFYFMGQIYPMAIFSQQNEKTKVDFRNYDYARPNRCVPYTLPENIAGSIRRFMESASLNCGSLDIVFSSNKEYVFLEVNPIGQFQWLDHNCNYYLDRIIADYLINPNNISDEY